MYRVTYVLNGVQHTEAADSPFEMLAMLDRLHAKGAIRVNVQIVPDSSDGSEGEC
jgi:hypothetical protein